MSYSDAELYRSAWKAFIRGDVEGATAALDPQVRWYAAGDPKVTAHATTARMPRRSSGEPLPRA